MSSDPDNPTEFELDDFSTTSGRTDEEGNITISFTGLEPSTEYELVWSLKEMLDTSDWELVALDPNKLN